MTRWHVLVLVALGAIVLVAVLFVQDADDYREDLASLLGDALGHPVTLSGPLELTWQPSPALTANEVRMSAAGAEVQVASVRMALDSYALIARRLVPREVRASGVHVALTGPPLATLVELLPDTSGLPVPRVELRDVEVRAGGRAAADAAAGDEPWLRLSRVDLSELTHADGARVEIESESPRALGRARLVVRDAVLALREIQVDSAYGPLEGTLEIEPGAPRSRIDAQLRANALSLPAIAGRADGPPASSLARLAGLAAHVDGRVMLRIGRLSVGGWRLAEVELPVRLRDGALNVTAAGVLAGGPLSADLALRPVGDGARGHVALDLRQADAGDALVMAGLHAAERGGRLDVQARLRSDADGAALLAGLVGDIVLDAREVTLRASDAQLAASDVYAALMRMLRGKRGNRVGLECVTARLAVRDGVLTADETLAAQSQDINAVGSGTLSLPGRTVDLRLLPWPRPSLGPSARAVADEVLVRGDLDAPEVRFEDAPPAAGGAARRERTRGDSPCAPPGSTVPVDAWS